MSQSLFIDSWGWITLANRGETNHAELSTLYRHEVDLGTQIVTSDYVLDEVITFLYAKMPHQKASVYLETLLNGIKVGTIRKESITPKRFEKTWKMRLKYKDHGRISFTDFTSFIVMQELHIKRVVTQDHHFEEINLGFQLLP